jgi:phenylpropionate dioxygenase-like ring-hydroxylating dioxygenase large terminal subunit
MKRAGATKKPKPPQSGGEYFRSLVDLEAGTVDRRIFVAPDIYEMELRRIFARAWNFMCHESQIPRSGDYFRNFIGEDSVIVTRDREGTIQVLLNTCRHRGNTVCRAEMGHARNFVCSYHGWTYDLSGRLIGVPGHKDLYHQALELENWSLVRAAQVECYKGFVFATMDPAAPPLEEYLGAVGRLGLGTIVAHGDVEAIDGVQKYRIGCNWKVAVDNIYDWYHPATTHASSMQSGYAGGKVPWSPNEHLVALGEYGHAISGPKITHEMRDDVAHRIAAGDQQLQDEGWRDGPRAALNIGELGPELRGHPGIFPNLWIASNGTQLCLRLPRGPQCTEVWWFTLLDKNLSQEERAAGIARANHFFGPAGMFEQDDGENWTQATRACGGAIGSRYPMNLSMDLGRGKIRQHASGIPFIESNVNEHAQRWTYRAWAEWMAAEDWPELKRRHSVPTETL